MKFILASGNSHKASEFNELFINSKIEIAPASGSLEVIEDGKTFPANAHLKAKAYFDNFQVPTLADDSGLVLEDFPELLGVESARFAPELKSYSQKCEKLLEIFSQNKDATRAAYFVCYLCFYINPSEILMFEGRVRGKIGNELSGDHGFGYDPIFIPDGQSLSLAQLPEWKNINSHRAKASIMATEFFKNYLKD